jgi:PAS domain S-box-containing protein
MKSAVKAVILIVDDKPANILALESLLADKDRLLLSATNGNEALQIALNKPVDLIILDVQMPQMDGFEVAQILKSNKRTRDIPIIFATAESREHQFIMKGYGEGAIDYLSKPLNPEIVKAKVAVLLQLQLQKKELVEKNSSLQRCALLIDNSADIIGIVDARTFRIEEINSAFTNTLGYSREDCKETPLTFYLSNEDRAMVQALSKKGKESLSFETRIYCKDRSLKWLQWNVVARYGKWFVNARDITEIKEVEKVRNYLATVVKQSSDAIYIHDEGGTIITWNEGAEKIYGYSEQEALRMKIWNIIPEFVQAEAEEMISRIIRGQKVQDQETRRITRHGKLVDVLFSASLITEVNDHHLSIAVTERDITRQKKAEDRLRENEAFLKSILNTLGDAVVVADSEGRPVLLNPAAERILGRDSKPVGIEEWTAAYGLFYPDAVTPFPTSEIPLVQAIQGKESAQVEMFIRNKEVPEGLHVTTSSNPLKDGQSAIVGGVSVIHDISERKKAEGALKESELRFRNLFEYAPYPMWVYDLETLRFLEVNQPAINHYGYAREEFLRMGISDIRPKADMERLVKDVQERDEEVQSSRGWQHCLRSGQVIDVEITSHLIDFRGHKAALVIAKDITDQKKAEARIRQLNEELLSNVRQLEATNKELESFSYSVSHDLRAPLRGLNGYSQMLQEDYGSVLDDEARRLLGNIQRNAHRMGVLIDDLLDFSRLGRKELQKVEINMDELVKEVVSEISHTTPHAAVIKIHGLSPADADAALIRQVWVNLVSNAVKYSGKKEKPQVEIGSNHQDAEVVYYVKDNGTGFNMKYADKLFGVFQRLHNRTDFEGTGIGLAIVQRIVSKHGGRVWAEAKENEGATFYFTLPRQNLKPIQQNEPTD